MALDLLLTIVLGVLIGMFFTLSVTNMAVLVCAFALGVVVVGVTLMQDRWRRAVEGPASEYGDEDDSASEDGYDNSRVYCNRRGREKRGRKGYKKRGRKGRRKGGRKQGKKRGPHGGRNGWRDRFGWGRYGTIPAYGDWR
ncbi:MAG: hypothetical protein Q9212_001202 [Teloschistes hypoglaucus]